MQNCQSNDHNFFHPISPLFGSNYTRFRHYSFLSFSVVNTKNNVIGIFSDFFLMEEYKWDLFIMIFSPEIFLTTSKQSLKNFLTICRLKFAYDKIRILRLKSIFFLIVVTWKKNPWIFLSGKIYSTNKQTNNCLVTHNSLGNILFTIPKNITYVYSTNKQTIA